MDKASGHCQPLASPPPSPFLTPTHPTLSFSGHAHLSACSVSALSSKCCSSLLNHFPCRCWFQLPDINPQLKFPTLRMITFPPSALTYISLLALPCCILIAHFLTARQQLESREDAIVQSSSAKGQTVSTIGYTDIIVPLLLKLQPPP